MYPEYFADGKKMPATGNAPSVVNTVDLRKIAPLWARFVNETESPESVRKELGWVRDMYAYDLAALATGIEHELSECPESLLMAQPPADSELGNAFILHYTWGSEIYDKNEEFIWKFDKRSYLEGQYGKVLTFSRNPSPARVGRRRQGSSAADVLQASRVDRKATRSHQNTDRRVQSCRAFAIENSERLRDDRGGAFIRLDH